MLSCCGALVEEGLSGHQEAPKARGDGVCALIHIRESQRVQNAETTTCPLTPIIALLHCVVGGHVVNNDRCVLTKMQRALVLIVIVASN